MTEFLEKPVNFAVLREHLQRLVQGRSPRGLKGPSAATDVGRNSFRPGLNENDGSGDPSFA